MSNQVPDLTISDEIRLGMRKLCGHFAECDCQNGVFVTDKELANLLQKVEVK